jgi:hypothetical protein
MLAGLLCRGGASWSPVHHHRLAQRVLGLARQVAKFRAGHPEDVASERLSVPAGRLASGGRRGRRRSHSEPESSPASQRAGLRMNI